jgi:hypothetical protein
MARSTGTCRACSRSASGESTQARQAWQEALAIFEDIQDPQAAEVRAKLASS